MLPLVESRGVVASALEVAIDGAANLWLTPGAAIVQLFTYESVFQGSCDRRYSLRDWVRVGGRSLREGGERGAAR